MSRTQLCIAFRLAVIGVVLLVAIPRAAYSEEIDDVLPANTLLLITADTPGRLWENSAWKSLNANADFVKNNAIFQTALTKFRDTIAPAWKEKFSRLKAAFSGRTAFAAVAAPGTPAGKITVALFDVANFDAYRQLVNSLAESMTLKEFLVSGRQWVFLSSPVHDAILLVELRPDRIAWIIDPAGAGINPSSATVDKTALAAIDDALFKGPRLKSAPEYRSAMAFHKQRRALFAFYNFQTYLGIIRSRLANDVAKKRHDEFIRILGLDQLRGISFNAGNRRGRTLSILFIDCPVPRRGIWWLFHPDRPQGLDQLKHLPADSGIGGVFTIPLDTAAIWPVIRDIAGFTTPAGAPSGVTAFQTYAGQIFGADPATFIQETFKGPIVVAHDMATTAKSYVAAMRYFSTGKAPSAMLKWPIIVSIEIRNRKNAENLFDIAASLLTETFTSKNAPVTFSVKTKSDATMWVFEARDKNARALGQLIVLLTPRHLVFCGDVSIANKIAALDTGTGTPLSNDTGFQDMFKKAKPSREMVGVDLVLNGRRQSARIDAYLEVILEGYSYLTWKKHQLWERQRVKTLNRLFTTLTRISQKLKTDAFMAETAQLPVILYRNDFKPATPPGSDWELKLVVGARLTPPPGDTGGYNPAEVFVAFYTPPAYRGKDTITLVLTADGAVSAMNASEVMKTVKEKKLSALVLNDKLFDTVRMALANNLDGRNAPATPPSPLTILFGVRDYASVSEPARTQLFYRLLVGLKAAYGSPRLPRVMDAHLPNHASAVFETDAGWLVQTIDDMPSVHRGIIPAVYGIGKLVEWFDSTLTPSPAVKPNTPGIDAVPNNAQK